MPSWGADRAIKGRAPTAVFAAILAAFLSLPATAAAGHLFEYERAFGSALAPGGRFLEASGVATDGAGRVYVVDRGARRVEVYDSAEAGNAFLRTIGEGRLVDPVDVDIDERDRVYVSDAGADRIDVYDQFVRASGLLQTIGTSGSEPGQLSRPGSIRVDGGGKVHVVEAGNLRLTVFRSLSNGGGVHNAFRIGEPGVFEVPAGLAVDEQGTMYVGNDSAGEGRVRLWWHNGAYAGELGGPGGGPGQLASPAGLLVDGDGRILVADAGNHRLQAWNYRLELVDRYGGLGSGPDGFDSPADLDLAPGANLYVADRGNGRVVRLAYDDSDDDAVTGARDNCRGLFNPGQDDGDGDGRGDGCDDDSDGDSVPVESDLCPGSAPRVDRNRDGCGDPRSRISQPRPLGTYGPVAASLIRGRAAGDQLGVAGVEVAIRRIQASGARRGARSRGGCLWYLKRQRGFGPGSCRRPKFFTARGRRSWYATVRAGSLRPGLYTAISRARQHGGLVENRLRPRQNVSRFRVV